MKRLIILPLLLLASCAHTSIYRDGKPIARFEGDMTDVDFSDGTTHFAAKTVNHSAATLAQGTAAQAKIGTLGTAVASVAAAAALR